MTNTVTFFEFESKEFKEDKQDKYDEGKISLKKESIKYLEKKFASEEGEKVRFLEIRRSKIIAKNYVGIIIVGNLTIEILPKFLKDDDIENNKKKILKSLTWILDYSNFLEFKTVDISRLEKDDNFFDFIVKIFAIKLEELLRKNYLMDYVRIEESLKFVKGKIDFKKYYDPSRLHIIPCIYYERTIDNIINRTLKYVSFLLMGKTKSMENYRLLNEIMSFLEPVKLEPITPEIVETIKFTRLNEEFRPFINFSKIILKGSILSPGKDKIEFFSWMIPMEDLFEKFIAKVIKNEILKERKVKTQMKLCKLLYYNDKWDKELIPDIIIYNKNNDSIIDAIIDTKYKKIEEDVIPDQNDLYQMYTYGREAISKNENILKQKIGEEKRDLLKIILLYPDYPEYHSNTKFEKNFLMGQKKLIEIHVRFINLNKDFTVPNEFEKFKEELKKILDEI